MHTYERFAETVDDDWELAVELEGRGRVAVTFVLEQATAAGATRLPQGQREPAVADDAAPSGEQVPQAPRQPFSLLFRGPPEGVLPQGVYPLEHPELGRLEIFLVPISRTDDGVRYEAVFA